MGFKKQGCAEEPLTTALRADGSWDPVPTSGCSQNNENRGQDNVLKGEIYLCQVLFAGLQALLSEVRQAVRVDLESRGVGSEGPCPPWSPENRGTTAFCLSVSVPKGASFQVHLHLKVMEMARNL